MRDFTRFRAIVVALLLCLTSVLSVSAAGLLPGDGTSGWVAAQATLTSCPPHEGENALGVRPLTNQTASIHRTLLAPLAEGVYTFSGWAHIPPGSASVQPLVRIRTGEADPIEEHPPALEAGADYRPFSFSFTLDSRIQVESLTLMFRIFSTNGATLCFDELSLVHDAGTPPQPPPDDSPSPGPTDVPAGTPTPSPIPSSTPSQSVTPLPTAKPEATPSSTPEPPLAFVNGGFEQGLYGWRKHGGELTTTESAHSGGSAGRLISDSKSTKWAYQLVEVDPDEHYEFSAYLRPDAGVTAAFLRISWYASTDGSGQAISTHDSTTGVVGPSGAFILVSTGPVQPPSGALTARLRVMLTPVGSARAVLDIDDAAFEPAAPPTPTPTASPTATSTAVPTATAQVGAPPTVASVGGSTPPPAEALPVTAQDDEGDDDEEGFRGALLTGSDTDRIAQVSTASREVAAGRSGDGSRTSGLDAEATSQEDGSSLPIAWLLGGVLLAVGLGGAYWQNRRLA